MSEYQAEIDAARSDEALAQRVTFLENIIANWMQNGAEGLFGQSGGQLFGGGSVRLDNTGLQFLTKAGTAKDITWVDSAFSPDPSGDNRAVITGQAANSSTSVIRLSAYTAAEPSAVTGIQINGLGAANSVQFANVFFQPDSWDSETISSGVLTVDPGAHYTVQAQTGTTDDLDSVLNSSSGAIGQGAVIWLKSDAGDTITVKHGTGNIFTADGADITLTGTMILQFVIANASGHLYEVGRGASSSGGGGMTPLVVKSADTTRQSTATSAVDDHLLAPIGANENWVFEFVFNVESAATPDFKFQIVAPSGAVGTVQSEALGATTNAYAGADLSVDIPVLSSTWPQAIRVRVGVDNGANAGNVALHWAQNTSTASDTTVTAGSYILGAQVA